MFTPATTSDHFQEIDVVITTALEDLKKDANQKEREEYLSGALTAEHQQDIRTNLLNSSNEDLAAYRAKPDDYKNLLVLLLDEADRKTFSEKLKPTEAELQLQAQQAAEAQRQQQEAEELQRQQELAQQQVLIARLEALQAQQAAEEQRKQQEAEELQRQQQIEQQRQLLIAQELAARQAAEQQRAQAEQQRAQEEAIRQAAQAEVARIGL